MSERLDDFGSGSVAAVTFAPPDLLAAHRERLDLAFPLLADPDRTLYRRFGLDRGSWREVWGLGTLKLYRELLSRGRRLRGPLQDTRQLGGDFVIDGGRRLVAAYRPRSPDARPSVDELVAAMGRAQSAPGA